MNNKLLSGHIDLLVSAILWGGSIVVLKNLIWDIPPMTINFFRFFIAALTLFFIAWHKKVSIKIEKKEITPLVIKALTGVSLYYFLETLSLKYLEASIVGIILGIIPIFTLAVDIVLNGRRVKPFLVLSFGLSILGIGLTVADSLETRYLNGSLLGYLLIFGSNCSWVFYTYISKKYNSDCPNLIAIAYQMLFASWAFIPGLFTEIPKISLDLNWYMVSLQIILLALPSSAFAYYFYFRGLKKIDMSIASLYLNLIPVISLISSCLFLGEKLTIFKTSGALLVALSLASMVFAGNDILGGKNGRGSV
ncbi:MAG: DMT family transporter [Psychrilyobacter sp.]|uniref:DMT family transporter n=1 Tax=Psychrilyobacter sp. TaxID=2586924 RepID=UPI003C782811